MAAASATRRTRATKAARRTGVDEAAFVLTTNDAKDNDAPLPHDDNPDDGANNDADDNAERGAKQRGAKPRAAEKADEYDARRVCAATTPHNSNDDSNNSADEPAKPRATDKADEATQDCTRRVRAAIACKSAMAT